MIKIVIVEIFQNECAFLSSMNWNATNKNLTENNVRIMHFFMKESKGRFTIKKVANVNNSNNPKVKVSPFFMFRKLNIKQEKVATKLNHTCAKMQQKLQHLRFVLFLNSCLVWIKLLIQLKHE